MDTSSVNSVLFDLDGVLHVGNSRFPLADDVKKDFSHFRQSNTAAEYIVVVDIGKAWTYDTMNEVFNCLKNGAKLIAIHKNRFWQTESGLQMDIGGFITGLEYAAGTQAMIIGKPATEFFQIALADLKLPASEVLMIVDDVDSDVWGAQKAGIRGVLVRTGKFREEYLTSSPVTPDLVIDSVADLPALLGFQD